MQMKASLKLIERIILRIVKKYNNHCGRTVTENLWISTSESLMKIYISKCRSGIDVHLLSCNYIIIDRGL
jgi:hypothetical protein